MYVSKANNQIPYMLLNALFSLLLLIIQACELLFPGIQQCLLDMHALLRFMFNAKKVQSLKNFKSCLVHI